MSVARSVFAVLRTLHVHLTLASLLLLLFFAVTGILLVHSEACGLDAVTRSETTFSIPPAELARSDRLTVVERLRAHGAFGAVDAYDDGEDEIQVAFSRPAGRASASIDKRSGEARVVREVHGWLAALGDLHKGKQSGAFWIVIDVAGGLWILAALTGICLWWQLKKRHVAGWIWLGIGTALSVLATWWLTPW